MPLLGVNIDHVATLRQARYRSADPAPAAEPDPLLAAHEAILGGADIITLHLREDRRHIQDRDLELIQRTIPRRINLEMGATPDMVRLALTTRPHMVTLVPEGRQEVTTEGGLDAAGMLGWLIEELKRLADAGITTSAFIDADSRQVEAAKHAGFDMCEVHTGPYAEEFARSGGNILSGALAAELEEVAVAGGAIRAAGMRFNAGHGLNYANVARIACLPGLAELHIGHAIVSRALFTGLRSAVAEMRRLITEARPPAGA
ncbi:MAG: pyridoxine 5'-phosphate synthase [Phycisphaerales bacterium]